MPDLDADLDTVRGQILDAAGKRLAERPHARRRGWLAIVVLLLVFGGGTVAVAAGVLDDSSAKLVSHDLTRIAALSPASARHRPTVLRGRTIHAFTKAADGFNLDVVPTSDGGFCMVLRQKKPQHHAETCVARAQNRPTETPMLAAIAADGSGEGFGVAPPRATSGVFTLGGRAIPLRLRHGYWLVRFPKGTNMPPGDAVGAVARGHASFR